MIDPALDLDELTRQQLDLRRSGQLSRLHLVIVGISVIVTILAWYTSSSLLEQRAQHRFEQEVDRVLELVRERMHHYEDALLSGVATIQAMEGAVTRASWRRYADNLQLAERYPGIRGIGLIRYLEAAELGPFTQRIAEEHAGYAIHPAHEFDFNLPIVYIEPEADNAAALGLDVAFEHNRRVAALRARRLGTSQISGPIVLVQDEDRTPGFLFYAPYYEDGIGRHARSGEGVSSAYRQQHFDGLVYAPLVVGSLVAGTLDQGRREVQFSIRDGQELLFSDLQEGEGAQAPYAGLRQLDLYGRTWTFEFRSVDMGLGGTDALQPWVVLMSGLVIDAMLLALFWLVSRANRRVLGMAERMTGDLASHAQALIATNEELRNYAHIVSHDLQTPIRGIQDLAGFIREDLDVYLASNEPNPEIVANLDRLVHQATRGQSLITGILDYSSVGVLDEPLSVVDVGMLIDEIGLSLGVADGQLIVEDGMPVFRTHAVRLGQVLANLIGNAFKYHPERPRARVRVSVVQQDGFYRFEVSDNGPGIEPRYQERIFQVFEKLEASADGLSSGIGLSIVRKSVELLGGTVGVESALGQGATFRFDWPSSVVRRAA